MRLESFKTALIGLSVVMAPTIAAAAPVQTPLTQPEAEATAAGGATGLTAGEIGVFLLAVGAVGAGIASGVSGDDSPNSP